MTNDGTPLFREGGPPLREIVLPATYAVMSPICGLLRLTVGKDPKARLWRRLCSICSARPTQFCIISQVIANQRPNA